MPGKTEERGAFVGFGNTAEAAHDAVLGRRQRGSPADGRFNSSSVTCGGVRTCFSYLLRA